MKLAREGVKKIAVHYLTRQDEAEKTVSQLRDVGADGVLVQGDTSNANRAEEIVHEAAHKLGGCDIFVQSVIPRLEDIYEHTLATEVPLAKWQLAFDTQVRAFLWGAGSREVHDAWRPHPGATYTPGGRTGGWQPWVGMRPRPRSTATGRYFAVALGRYGITVNSVSPGCCDDTTVLGQTPRRWQDAIKHWVEAGWTPMRRLGTPEDIANVCALHAVKKLSFALRGKPSPSTGEFPDEPGFPAAPASACVVGLVLGTVGLRKLLYIGTRCWSGCTTVEI